MTKKTKHSSQYDQPSLFDFMKEKQATPRNGSLNIIKEIKSALSDDLRHAVDEHNKELSRAQVAALMTDLIGEEITLTMLNNWTATSHPHEMPLSYLPAFIQATGGQRRISEAISRHSGLHLLPGPDALRAEIQRFDEIARDAMKEKQKRMFYLREVEGK